MAGDVCKAEGVRGITCPSLPRLVRALFFPGLPAFFPYRYFHSRIYHHPPLFSRSIPSALSAPLRSSFAILAPLSCPACLSSASVQRQVSRFLQQGIVNFFLPRKYRFLQQGSVKNLKQGSVKNAIMHTHTHTHTHTHNRKQTHTHRHHAHRNTRTVIHIYV
jgi:hypothetical protein